MTDEFCLFAAYLWAWVIRSKKILSFQYKTPKSNNIIDNKETMVRDLVLSINFVECKGYSFEHKIKDYYIFLTAMIGISKYIFSKYVCLQPKKTFIVVMNHIPTVYSKCKTAYLIIFCRKNKPACLLNVNPKNFVIFSDKLIWLFIKPG